MNQCESQNESIMFFRHNLTTAAWLQMTDNSNMFTSDFFLYFLSHFISSSSVTLFSSVSKHQSKIYILKKLWIIDVYIREAAEREIAKSKHIWKHLLAILSSHVAQKIALLKKSKHAARSANPPNNELYLSFAQKQQMQVWCEGV